MAGIFDFLKGLGGTNAQVPEPARYVTRGAMNSAGQARGIRQQNDARRNAAFEGILGLGQGGMDGRVPGIRTEPERDRFEKAGSVFDMASSAVNGYVGLQQLGMAKKQFGLQKQAFALNREGAIKSFNGQIQDKYAAAVATDPTRRAEMDAYRDKYMMAGG